MFLTGTKDKRQRGKLQAWDSAQDFSAINMTPDNFHSFYIKFVNLRFPIKVAHLLELRYLINHTVDKHQEPPLTEDYRQFRDSLQAAVDSFIDNRRHSERMLKTLSMIRDIHYTHSLNSRNAERRLRNEMDNNRVDRMKYIRYGLFFILAGVSTGILWLAMPEPNWLIKLLPLGYAYLAWFYFHKLPGLDREFEEQTLELNDVLRRRVDSLNWKTLIHKFALVLGFKRVPGIEVFHIDHEHDRMERSAYH